MRPLNRLSMLFAPLPVLLLASCASTGVPMHAQHLPKRQAVDSIFETVVRPGEPGVAIIVVDDGKVLFQRAGGLADLVTRQPLTLSTPIYIASIGKQFTAVSIMMLAERGALSLDDSLPKYFPETASYAAGVTLRRMLNHTSGLIDHNDIRHDSLDGWTNDSVLTLMRQHPRLLFPPGDRSSYSNTAFVLLSEIVEKVTGLSYRSFVERNFLTPLRMTRTTVVDAPGREPAGRALGYVEDGDRWVEAGYHAYTTGSGGIYSTAEDLLKWDQAMRRNQFISARMLAEASEAARRNNGRPTENGLGWLAEYDAKGEFADQWYTASFGNFKGYQGMMKRFRDRPFTTIVLTNRGVFPWDLQAAARRFALPDSAP